MCDYKEPLYFIIDLQKHAKIVAQKVAIKLVCPAHPQMLSRIEAKPSLCHEPQTMPEKILQRARAHYSA